MDAFLATLPSKLRAFIAGQIASGAYESVEELLAEAVRQLEDDATELDALREFRLRPKAGTQPRSARQRRIRGGCGHRSVDGQSSPQVGCRLRQVHISADARRDIDDALQYSEERFGVAAELRYRGLIETAVERLRIEPAGLGARP
jgi:putative addiction module CopG family antidote